MMNEAIKQFAQQFTYQPVIENKDAFQPADSFVVCGMGGSHLAAGVLKTIKPELDPYIHSNYGLPQLPASELKKRLLIFSSYSGNTEEIVDGLQKAIDNHYNLIVIATGGKLIDLAQQHALPYIQMPASGIQPRSALGYSYRALLKAMLQDQLMSESNELADKLKPEELESEGKKLAEELKDHVPILYTSEKNKTVGYNWKIKFNETGKIPAFYNVFPELNHNEMTGFDVMATSAHLSEKFHFIIITDTTDHPRVQKRMSILSKQYQDRKLPVTEISLIGSTPAEKIFSSLLIADWAAFHTAAYYGLESEQVPMVEEFKKLMAR